MFSAKRALNSGALAAIMTSNPRAVLGSATHSSL